MADSDKAVGDVSPAAAVSAEQVKDSGWPRPGDEGYVTPDGTEQSRRQLEQNRQAAADRMAAGSTVHGAPLATPGPQARSQAEASVERAEAYSGPTEEDRKAGVTEFIRESSQAVADEFADEGVQVSEPVQPAAPVVAPDKRTADDGKAKSTR